MSIKCNYYDGRKLGKYLSENDINVLYDNIQNITENILDIKSRYDKLYLDLISINIETRINTYLNFIGIDIESILINIFVVDKILGRRDEKK